MQGDRIVLRTLAVYTPDQVAEGELRLPSTTTVLYYDIASPEKDQNSN